jgi:glutamine cyclotransferase
MALGETRRECIVLRLRTAWRHTFVLGVALGACVAPAGCDHGSDRPANAERVVLPPGMAAPPSSNADARPPSVPFASSTPRLVPAVVRSWPHDTAAFTQGLAFHNGRLYESTGLEGRSQIRELDPTTFAVRRRVALAPSEFGEGIAAVGRRLYQVTWRHGIGHVYDLPSLALVDSFRYAGEGWGLATDGQSLYMSDGTSQVRVIDPSGFRELRRIQVQEAGHHVWALNELEWVRGELWANIYQTPYIARIDPSSGNVVGWVDLAELVARFKPDERSRLEGDGGVANGIAFDSTTGELLVTGKLWPLLFRLVPPPPAATRTSVGESVQ